jgi:hypothetical protein
MEDKGRGSSTVSQLVGRAGLALVEFQLGRRGFDFIQTAGNSKSGDIWAEIETGRVSIEVKTTARGKSWFVKTKQTNSEFFCLVSLQDAAVYVLTRQEMEIAVKASQAAHPGIYIVYLKSLPLDAFEGWSRLGSSRMSDVKRRRQHVAYTVTRKVTRKMADGTVKTYVYPPTATA